MRTMCNPENGDRSTDVKLAAEADRWARACVAGPLSPEGARAFNQWISAHPEHERRFHAAKQLLRELTHVANTSEYAEWIKPPARQRLTDAFWQVRHALSGLMRPRLAVFASAIGLVTAISIAAFFALQLQSMTLAPPVETAVAEVRDIDLPDGSRVTLGAASSVRLAFTEAERRVILSDGEAFFDVTKDEERPFLVVAGNTLVRVLGTKFDVSLGTDAIDVAVSEGRVEVIRPNALGAAIDEDDIKHVLIAGQRVTAPKRGAVRAVRAVDVDDVAAWRRGELRWADTTIRDIVADINRYSEYRVLIEARNIADLEYTLAVQADQIDEAIELIAASLDLEIIERANGDRVLH